MVRVGLPKSIIKKYGISKKAWQVFRGRRKSKSRATKPKTRKTKRRRNLNMARKKRRSRGKNLIATIEKFIGVGVFLAPGARRANDVYQQTHNIGESLVTFATTYGGIRRDGKFDMTLVGEAWGPFLVYNVARWGIHKLNGIIRKI